MKKVLFTFALVCALFAVQFLGVGLLSVYAGDLTPYVDGGGNEVYPPPSIHDFITGLTLTEEGSDSEELGSDGNPEPKDGAFRMTYSFELPQDSEIDSEDYFFLDLPDEVTVPVNVTGIVIQDSTYGINVFTANLLMATHPSNTTGEDAILIEFHPDIDQPANNFTFTGEFWFEASFDEEDLGTGGTIVIEFDSGRISDPYNKEVEFIADPPPQAEFSKSNNFDSNNPHATYNESEHRHYITWTLDVNSNEVDMGEGVVIRDGISTTWMEYIGNVTHTVGSAAYTADYDTATDTLTISFNEAVSTRQVFTYQTAVLPGAYIDRLETSSSLTISNTADLVFPNGEEIASNTSTLTYNLNVIEKSLDETIVTGGIDHTNHLIYWEIIANPNSYIVNDAYVTDIIPDDFTMDESSIRYEFMTSGTVYSDTDTPFENPALPTSSIYYEHTGQDYSFNLGDIDEPVKITFTTSYDDEIYYTQENEEYTNTAYFHPPTDDTNRNDDGQGVGFNTEVLQKSRAAYDYTNITEAYIDWRIIINPNADTTTISLQDVYVYDIIPDGLVIDMTSVTVEDAVNGNSLAINSEVAAASITYDAVSRELRINFDPDNTREMTDAEMTAAGGARDVIEDMYVITYRTHFENAYTWKQNIYTDFNNRAYFISYNAGSGSDNAGIRVNPQVITKDFRDYDYDTHYIDWRVRINNNNNDLYNPIFTDYIPEGMRLVESTIELREETAESRRVNLDYADGYYTYTEHDPAIPHPDTVNHPDEYISGTLVYSFFPREGDAGYSPLNCITDDYYMYFSTEFVDMDELSENHLGDGDVVTVNNIGYLVHDEDNPTIQIEDPESDSFTSSVVEKISEYTDGNQYIDWVVTINKNQIEIYGPDPDPYPENTYSGPIIYDDLQEGLVLDIESITLYHGDVHSDGNIDLDIDNDGNNDLASFDREQVNYNANTRRLTFEFEDTINSCYVMTFTTYIDNDYSGPFDNTATFHALAGNPENQSQEQAVRIGTGGGYAAANIGHVKLTKVDEADAARFLEGAVFELIDEYGTVVDVQEADANGVVLFEFVFFGRQYYVRESQTPYGYSGDTETLTPVSIDPDLATDEGENDPDRTYEPDEPITNAANPVSIQFMKQDGLGSGLPGAVFGIYEDGTSEIFATSTSDAAGIVSFTELTANTTYHIVELSAPLGYLPDPGAPVLTAVCTVGDVPFAPSPDVVINTEDSTANSSIVLMKYTGNGTTPLPNCVFGLYRAGSPYLLATATSGADGMVVFNNIPAGSYEIRELSAPDGYVLSQTIVTVTVGVTTGVYYTNPTNLLNYLEEQENPRTGNRGSNYYLLIIGLALICALGYVLYIYKQRKSEVK